MFDIKENLKKLPDSPGVYIHKDELGRIIYVGKALSLRRRVRQYFQSGKIIDSKVRAMVSQIAEFEYINTATEMEAFILECNLIKKHRPKYNILLRDDKTYPYIKVTVNERWPRIIKTRIVGNDGGKYFGPYSDVKAVNQMVELLNDVYVLKKCSKQVFRNDEKACLNYHIGTCEGVCIGEGDREKYLERIDMALDFLNGRSKDLIKILKKKMEDCAKDMNYEEAAKYRDRIASAESLKSVQRVVLSRRTDIDIVIPLGIGEIVLFLVRDGKLTGRETFSLEMEGESKRVEEIKEFIRLYYSDLPDGPKEILVPGEIDEKEILQEYLEHLWGRKVKINLPKRGEKKDLMNLAKKDAKILKEGILEKKKNKIERKQKIAGEIRDIIKKVKGSEAKVTDDREYRIEAYDISNTNGVDTVGGMVVFEGLRKDKKSYRRFKIKSFQGQDDYAGMQEVIYRRFRRAEKGDFGFSKIPDMILIDGGKGHISSVTKVIKAMGMNVCVLGMVKDDAHRTRGLVYMSGDDYAEIPLRGNSMLFGYIGTIQEEVHRFAIEYHRGLRDKGKLNSVLDDIRGIGPVKRNRLLAYFESVENIKKATKTQLEKVPGLTEKNAEDVYKYFH